MRSSSLLQPGDTVAVVAPASPVRSDALARGCAVLRSWGLTVHDAGPEAPADGYLAADDADRLAAVHQALAVPGARAVWAARGGYGCARILPRIDYPARANPPLLLGFSDISLWLAHAAQRAGWPAVHGPNVTTLALLDDESLAAVHRFLFTGAPSAFAGLEVVHPGVAQGALLPMNLAMLLSVAGTAHMPDLADTILVLEDVNEPPYRVDRMLLHLSLLPAFAGVRGLVLGDFGPALADSRLRTSLAQLARLHDLPCVLGLPVGHGARNRCLPVSALAHLDARRGVLAVGSGTSDARVEEAASP